MTTRAAPQVPALTGLRGIAAWWVVLYHLRLSLTGWLPPRAIGALATGYLAVDLFFLLSGFVIALNYADRVAEGGGRVAAQFWWRRFARVWPLHAAILLGLLAFALVLRATGRDSSAYPLGELPLHLLLVQNWGLTGALTWNHPAWSISAEAGAYLLFPVLAIGLAQVRTVPGLVLLAAALAAGLHALFALTGHGSLGDDIPRLGLWRCAAQFAIGMVLWRLWQGWHVSERLTGMIALLWLLAAAALVGCVIGVPETATVPLAFAGLLMAVALDRGWVAKFLASRPLMWVGDLSYATYLLHVPLLVLWKLLFVGPDLQLSPVEMGLYIVTLGGSSALLHYRLERPAQAWLRRHPPRWAVPRREPA